MVSDDDYIRRLEIKAEVFNLPVGSTSNDVKCPWCHHDKSFSVTKTPRGDLLFLCHRSSCGEAGYIRDKGNSSPAPTGRVFTGRVYDHPTNKLVGNGLSILLDRYRLTELEIQWAGWLYSPQGNVLVMPVYSPHRSCRGHVTKAFDQTTIPKNLTYKEVDDPWMGWYIRNGVKAENKEGAGGQVVIVEDGISALKASRYAPTVALMGTNLNYEGLDEILQVGKNVSICLDADATSKAYKYAKQFAVFGNFRTVPLSKDLKNMNDKELEEWSEHLK